MEKSSHSDPSQSEERFDSWKEIAAYLRRGVSTLQRWEQEDGLPIRRISIQKRANVFAYKSELDAWLNKFQTKEAVLPKAKPRIRKSILGAVGVCAAVVVGVAIWWVSVEAPVLTPASPDERIWILLTQFENRTDEEVLDGTLESALEQELARSRFVHTVQRDRINDTLELMREPTDSQIDPELGREICLRDGGIRAMLNGSIDKFQSGYSINLQIIDPKTNVSLAASNWQAEKQEQILPVIHESSEWVRAQLGDKWVSSGEYPSRLRRVIDWMGERMGGRTGEQWEQLPLPRGGMERVTTRSLKALQFYTEGVKVYREGAKQRAELLFREAVAQDSEFASAYLLLAWSIRGQATPQLIAQIAREMTYEERAVLQSTFNEQRTAAAMPYMERAVELSHLTNEPEQHFILGCYYDWRQEYEEASAHYEIVVDLQPDHYWAANNLMITYSQQGRMGEFSPYQIQKARLYSTNFILQVDAALALIGRYGDLDAARPFLERARELIKQDPRLYTSFYNAQLASLGVWRRWLENDVEGALEEAESLRQTLLEKRREGLEVKRHAAFLGLRFLSLGKLEVAEELRTVFNCADIPKIGLPRYGDGGFENILSIVRGDTELLRPYSKLLQSWAGQAWLVVLRLDPEAATLLEENPELRFRLASQQLVMGKLALLRGEYSESISLFGEGIIGLEGSMYWDQTDIFLVSLDLAEAWVALGDYQAAIDALERVSFLRRNTYAGDSVLWLEVQERLAKLYRQVGRDEEAQQVEDELRQLLSYADPDHPLLARL